MKKNGWKALVLSASIFLFGGAKLASCIEKNANKEPIEVVSVEETNIKVPTVDIVVIEDEVILEDTSIKEEIIEMPIETEKPIEVDYYDIEMTKIANEVIEGKWSTGEERRRLLENNGYNYYDVMDKVNSILGYEPSKPREKHTVTGGEGSFVYFNSDSTLYDENGNVITYTYKYDKAMLNGKNNNSKLGVILQSGIEGYVFDYSINSMPGTYVEVDISDQKLHMFIDNEEVFSADVITGCPSVGTTPGTNLGYTEIYEKLYQTYLVGPTWKSYVDIFMRFNDSAEGFHDADGWRGDWEYDQKDRYISNGSHGCVNMKQADVELLDGYTSVGTKVLIHK